MFAGSSENDMVISLKKGRFQIGSEVKGIWGLPVIMAE